MVVYLTILNLFALILMKYDKYNAINNNERVPNKLFYFISILGGPIGIMLGMKFFRHKTKQRSYYLITVLSIIIWITLIYTISLNRF